MDHFICYNNITYPLANVLLFTALTPHDRLMYEMPGIELVTGTEDFQNEE
jgi:hypothetical protein